MHKKKSRIGKPAPKPVPVPVPAPVPAPAPAPKVNSKPAPKHEVNCGGNCWLCNPHEMRTQGAYERSNAH